MKAFVIKNKEGKYYQSCYNQSPFTDNLFNANKYQYKEETEKILNNSFTLVDTLEPVEITITEGDLEQQLAEKDEELEELKEHIKFLENKCLNEINVKLVNVTKEKVQQIRKQVCDEIRDKVLLSNGMISNAEELLNFRKMLDQIEQAKESIENE